MSRLYPQRVARANTDPLRRVVGYKLDANMRIDELECGHTVADHSRLYPPKAHRRCPACRQPEGAK